MPDDGTPAAGSGDDRPGSRVEQVDGMGDDAIPKPPPKRKPVPRPRG